MRLNNTNKSFHRSKINTTNNNRERYRVDYIVVTWCCAITLFGLSHLFLFSSTKGTSFQYQAISTQQQQYLSTKYPDNHNNNNKSNENRIIHPVREIINDVDVIWTAPPDHQHYKGIIFVAHGCKHSHTDFWQRSTSNGDNTFQCFECLGLPEKLAVVRTAVYKYNLIVVSMSSVDRQSKCWKVSKDSPRVASVLKIIQEKYTSSTNNNKLPIFAYGGSSGGTFVSQLGSALRNVGLALDGYISQISASEKLDLANKDLKCAVYITMNRDTKTHDRAIRVVQILSDASIPVMHIRIPPLPIDAAFFANRITTISKETSARLFEVFKENQIIAPFDALPDASKLIIPKEFQTNNNYYYVAKNPKRSNFWQTIAFQIISPEQDTLENDSSALSEVMNAAYGQHQSSRDGFDEALHFCLNQQQQLQQQQQQVAGI